MVWPTLGSRTAKEQNRRLRTISHSLGEIPQFQQDLGITKSSVSNVGLEKPVRDRNAYSAWPTARAASVTGLCLLTSGIPSGKCENTCDVPGAVLDIARDFPRQRCQLIGSSCLSLSLSIFPVLNRRGRPYHSFFSMALSQLT